MCALCLWGCEHQEKSQTTSPEAAVSRRVPQDVEGQRGGKVVQTTKQSISRQEQANSQDRSQSLTPPKLLSTKEKTTQIKAEPKIHPVYRPSDIRPQHDDEKLAKLGIGKYESKRLILYTDINPEIAKRLPAYIDAAYKVWEEYFGPLPANREKTEFQITGYLIKDQELFRQAELIPSDLPPFVNGRHRELEFWINEQQDDYYRRHLMIHEATHCYMTTVRDIRIAPWYLEGMAELFGTHFTDEKGKIHFGLMPHNKQDFRGLGRITMIQLRIAEGRFKPLSEVTTLNGEDFLKTESYAWGWALCQFLNTHPRYRKRFRELGKHPAPSEFERGFQETFKPDMTELKTEWCLFAHNLQDAYDVKRTAIQFLSGNPLNQRDPPEPITISADRGWQSSKIHLEKGKNYRVTATGRFTLAEQPKPWVTEPQGISIRYFQGRPLGMLLATIRDETPEGLQTAGMKEDSMLKVIPIGREKQFQAEFTGTLYFRINDSFSELADNKGKVQVTIEEIPP